MKAGGTAYAKPGGGSEKTGTKFHPNNQVKADRPKKPSPFANVLKQGQYRYEGGEITRWFVDAWDHFESFEEACIFMAEQAEEKKYRYFCFFDDWKAIIDKYLFLRERIQNQDLQESQASKLYMKIGSNASGKRSENIFDFTNQYITAAS